MTFLSLEDDVLRTNKRASLKVIEVVDKKHDICLQNGL